MSKRSSDYLQCDRKLWCVSRGDSLLIVLGCTACVTTELLDQARDLCYGALRRFVVSKILVSMCLAIPPSESAVLGGKAMETALEALPTPLPHGTPRDALVSGNLSSDSVHPRVSDRDPRLGLATSASSSGPGRT